ncbi:hypothetical protein ACFO25_20365 [Paenactinomyces guangxiensis]|uniref:GGDEF domain-containing protein n=1 Tax=Paenactinomyces guangxiensis TaxID=1490290 RepID=A0A7W1WUB5_9BACL|nr:hypothetical protein [Paenactinomyces guangxiensis]MBA4496092.1 hypothetical protein [Paenactinomyces guangxiensis]MBH8593179.1 hypothetical protein [Paenactinomyces guangxiensis]
MSPSLSILSNKGIAIGVIGPGLLVEKIRDTIKAFPSFQPVFKVYQQREEVCHLAQELMDQAEVLLIAEYHAYREVKGNLDFRIPVHYIPLTGAGLIRSLYRLKKSLSVKKVSLDSLSKQLVEQSFADLDESDVQISYFDGSSHAPIEEIFQFHQNQFTEGGCDAVLTGIKSVSERLSDCNIPNEWVIPTQQDIIVSLERALLSTETRRNKESQIVVGIIHIDDLNRVMERLISEHEIQKLKLDIHRMLLDYVQCLDGHLTALGGDEYLFFTTRGIFERETRGYKSIPLLKDVKKEFGISLSMGMGFGKSANEAGTHARLALRQSRELGGHVCFIVREDRSVIGPVEMGPPMVYELAVTDTELLEKAEKAGMSAVYLNKLMVQVARQGKTDFTAQELASIIGVTLRSTHRILLQWMDAKLVEIVGVEKISTKGRPRQIYRLTFLENFYDQNMTPPE